MFSNIKTDKGSMLIMVLAICAVLSLSAMSTFYYTQKIISLYTEEIHGNSSKLKAESSGIKKLLSSNSRQKARFSVIVSQKTTGRADIQRKICLLSDISREGIHTAPFLIGTDLNEQNYFPLIDYNHIFRQPGNCKSSRFLGAASSSSGFRLSSSSSISSEVCRDSVPVAGQDVVVSANLEFSNDQLTVTQPIVIAALGYIDINSSVLLLGDSWIISSGDLHIRELKAPLGEQPKVTLFSGTGVVVVDRIIGSPKLKITAWLGISIPDGEFSLLEEIFPYYQSALTLGFCN